MIIVGNGFPAANVQYKVVISIVDLDQTVEILGFEFVKIMT